MCSCCPLCTTEDTLKRKLELGLYDQHCDYTKQEASGVCECYYLSLYDFVCCWFL